MAATYSIIDIELKSDIAIQYTKGGRVPLVFRRPRRVHFRNDHHLVIPESLMSEGSDLYLTADPARCLLLFGPEIWEPLKDKLLDLPRYLPQGGPLKRLLIGNARKCVGQYKA